jgi:hypothetical protein
MNGPAPPKDDAWYEYPDLVFNVASAAAPVVFWFYYLVGVAILFAAILYRGLLAQQEAEHRALILTVLAAVVGVALTVLAFTRALELAWLKGLIAATTAIVSGIFGAWLLRDEFSRFADWLKRATPRRPQSVKQ